MEERIKQELELLKLTYPDVTYKDRWILLRAFTLVEGWSPDQIPVCFFLRPGFPGVGPYGIYVPSGIKFQDKTPTNYKDKANPQPPFDGSWGVFSWEAESWRPTAIPETGHNLLNWSVGIQNRFREGC